MSNSVGKWFNETPLPTPGNMIFNDEEAPNELIDDGSDFRNEYYQEDVFPLSNVGKPHQEDDGKWNLGILDGTIADDLKDVKGTVDDIRSGKFEIEKIVKSYEAVETVAGLFTGGFSSPSDIAGLYVGQMLGWMIEHVEPIRKTADGVFGNPDMVEAYATSWENIRDRLAEVAISWSAEVVQGTDDFRGEAGDAYRQRAIQLVTRIAALGFIADGLKETTIAMQGIVEITREQILGILVDVYSAGVAAAVKILTSVGFRAAAAIKDYLLEIARAAAKMGIAFYQLWQALQELGDLAAPLGDALAQLAAEPVRTN